MNTFISWGDYPRITTEYQDLIQDRIVLRIVYQNSREAVMGFPLQLSKRQGLLSHLSAKDVVRLGQLAAFQYQSEQNARIKSLK